MTQVSDDDELAAVLEHAEAQARECQARLDAWQREDDAACDRLSRALASAERQLAAMADERVATRNRLAKMARERRALLSWRGVTWKGAQLLLRLLLALSAGLAFLMFSTNDELTAWPLFGVLVADAAIVWFLGDLADYLELTHG